MANFKTFSRYTGGTIETNRSGQSFIALRQPLGLAEGEDDILVTVTSEFVNRPDLLASNVYGNSDLWWAIYEFNNIADPFFNLAIGQVVRLPSLTRLTTAINNLQ